MGNLSQQAGKTLYSWIAVEKRFRPGEKLPNEVELSAQLGVSRATLREALRALLVQGVVEVRRGRGTFVTQKAAQVEDFGFDDLARVRGQLRDLFELRTIFEPRAARLACCRATQRELEDILTQRRWPTASAVGRTALGRTGPFTPPSSGRPTTNL